MGECSDWSRLKAVNGKVKIKSHKKCSDNFYSKVDIDLAITLVKGGVAFVKSSNCILKRYSYKQLRHCILKRDNHACHYCGRRAKTVDHMIPRSKGGRSTFTNCVASCSACNTEKKDMDYEDFVYSKIKELITA